MMLGCEEKGDGDGTATILSILYLAVCDISSILHSAANGPSALSIVELATEAKLLVRNLDRE